MTISSAQFWVPKFILIAVRTPNLVNQPISIVVQVEIKRAEPRDGSGKLGSGGGGMGGGGMGGGPGDGGAGAGAGQWGPPAAAPMSIIQGHNGQMGGPPINMPMAGPNIMQRYGINGYV